MRLAGVNAATVVDTNASISRHTKPDSRRSLLTVGLWSVDVASVVRCTRTEQISYVTERSIGVVI